MILANKYRAEDKAEGEKVKILALGKQKEKFQEQAKSKPTKAVSEKHSLCKVLLVEDDKLAQLVAADMIYNEFKVQVISAATGQQALKLAKNNNYDIIFMDIGLPDTTGIEVAKEIRNNGCANAQTPIIALTAHSSEDVLTEITKTGMSDFLVKPLDSAKVQKIFAKWLQAKPKAAASLKTKKTEKEAAAMLKKADPAVIDVTAALTVVKTSTAMLTSLELLVDLMPEYKAPIEEAHIAEDLQALATAAHKLVGAASYCGTTTLYNAAKKLEITAKTSKDKKKISSLVNKLFSEMDAVLKNYTVLVK